MEELKADTIDSTDQCLVYKVSRLSLTVHYELGTYSSFEFISGLDRKGGGNDAIRRHFAATYKLIDAISNCVSLA